MLKGISHIALMVLNLETALEQFLMLGYEKKSKDVIAAEEYGTKVFVVGNGNTTIELIEPVTEEKVSFYQERIKKFGYFMDHIGYYCDNIEETCIALKKHRFIPTTEIGISPIWGGGVGQYFSQTERWE